MIFPLRTVAALSLLALSGSAPAWELRLPTRNDALLRGEGLDFYQFVDRTFEGEKSNPWQGGQFGFVRNPVRSGGEIVYTRFHEGLDIRPTQRDGSGDPLDLVHAISDGRVVHTANVPSQSNYGRYIVVEHDWGDGPFYSLYAHLAAIHVQPGQRVRAGEPLARMGYTGAGIDQRRAHLHVELNLFLSTDFQAWHDRLFRDPNHHSLYNGLNLLGLDLAGLYQAHRRNDISASDFVRQSPWYFEVAVPGRARMELAQRYPWLLETRPSRTAPGSWRIRCTAWGLPVAITPSDSPVAEPTITALATRQLSHGYHTRGLLSGSGSSASLTRTGLNFIQLLTGF
ncbi:MAG: M23 family metallopeptidase [Verrucomicrobiales bacterium]|nr:M23 family metallopeptidase [Verrucomicrobiales bacterium]